MTRGRIIAGVVVLAVLGALGGGYAYSRATNVTAVTTATVTKQAITVTVNASGTVVPDAAVGVYAGVGGTLSSVAVTDGAKVAKGDVLAKIATGPLKLAVQQAESEWAAARAMPTGTTRLRTARNEAIQAARAAVDQARADLKKATIKAPSSGIVTVPDTTQKGAATTAGAQLFTITDPARLRFEAQVDEADVARVKTGQKAAVNLDAFPSKPVAGKVSLIKGTSVKTDTGGNAYPTRITLDSTKGVLRGMSGSADIAVSSVPDALVVPIQAVLADGSKRYVFVVTPDHKLVKTGVTLGESTDTLAQVTTGLNAGMLVVTSQLTALTDGMSVRVQ
ncbi:MAG: efflux RND transporter periplasmic adaptor subunit [Micropruina sp.]|nr:MAG: efflux RND transporter periplasmic adaptor subunit [Micropruina sp.]